MTEYKLVFSVPSNQKLCPILTRYAKKYSSMYTNVMFCVPPAVSQTQRQFSFRKRSTFPTKPRLYPNTFDLGELKRTKRFRQASSLFNFLLMCRSPMNKTNWKNFQNGGCAVLDQSEMYRVPPEQGLSGRIKYFPGNLISTLVHVALPKGS